MSKKRGYAASLITNENNLWVTGGAEGSQILSSTEYILKNGESIEGPNLPIGLAAHTVVGINSTFSMFIGGFISGLFALDLTIIIRYGLTVQGSTFQDPFIVQVLSLILSQERGY